jgi:hypothetical protein
VKSSDIAKESFFQEWMTEAYRLPQSGMTLQQLTESSLMGWLTLFTEDSHARTLASQERVRDWQESEAVYLKKSSEFAKRHPLNLFSLRTYRLLEQEEQLKFKKLWPASGMILDGVLYPLPKLAQTTSERDGFVLPTTTTIDTGSRFNKSASSRAKSLPTLGAMARFNLWPTPNARDYKDSLTQTYRGEGSRDDSKLVPVLAKQMRAQSIPTNGGQLNPMWVEWLMGLPIGHTELKPWVMGWFLCKSKRRLKS